MAAYILLYMLNVNYLTWLYHFRKQEYLCIIIDESYK